MEVCPLFVRSIIPHTNNITRKNFWPLMIKNPYNYFTHRHFSTNSTIIPAIIYKNAGHDKLRIMQENKGKSGIYRWTNTLNGNSYIGSSIDLERRLKEYFNSYKLKTEINKKKWNYYIPSLTKIWLFLV